MCPFENILADPYIEDMCDDGEIYEAAQQPKEAVPQPNGLTLCKCVLRAANNFSFFRTSSKLNQDKASLDNPRTRAVACVTWQESTLSMGFKVYFAILSLHSVLARSFHLRVLSL